MIRSASFGEVSGSDIALGDDETISVSTYATDESRWILDRVATQITQSLDGTRASEMRTYYDGEAFEGLALGSVERGAVTRTESWISGERFATDSRIERDSYGNATVTRDARRAPRDRVRRGQPHVRRHRATVPLRGSRSGADLDRRARRGVRANPERDRPQPAAQ